MEFTKKEAANMASETLHTYTNTYICQKESRAPREGGGFEAADDDEKLAMILDGACKERGVGMTIRKMWKKRFV